MTKVVRQTVKDARVNLDRLVVCLINNTASARYSPKTKTTLNRVVLLLGPLWYEVINLISDKVIMNGYSRSIRKFQSY